MANGVPDFGYPMPFVDQHRWRIKCDHRWIGGDHPAFSDSVQPPYGHASLFGGCGLPDAFRAVQENGGEICEGHVQFVVNDPPHIAALESFLNHLPKLPFTHFLRYRLRIF
jgi:hypothetical protein